MPNFTEALPLSLYIHLPWCVRKCPYCDFNSHVAPDSLPEVAYTNALLQELDSRLALTLHRPLRSIFFGGGTPSLFSSSAVEKILEGVAKRFSLAPDIEITLEANPGTIDYPRFQGYRAAGVNRLSLGVQSLQNDKLATLGRIHDRDHAIRAIDIAKNAGFTNFNIDLMHGLPKQTIADALSDLETALSFQPTHLSWYQLTIEPNTLFHHQPPLLPPDDTLWDIQAAGFDCLQTAGFKQYEVSAFSLPNKQCQHNLNYWEFGDYLGIGAGAHSKITNHETGEVMRFSQIKHPRDYLDVNKRAPSSLQPINEHDLVFEFMLNALRLTNGVSLALFQERTGLRADTIDKTVKLAIQKGLLVDDATQLIPSELGKKFLNDLTEMFL